MSGFGTFETCRPVLTMSVGRVDQKWLAAVQTGAFDPDCPQSGPTRDIGELPRISSRGPEASSKYRALTATLPVF